MSKKDLQKQRDLEALSYIQGLNGINLVEETNEHLETSRELTAMERLQLLEDLALGNNPSTPRNRTFDDKKNPTPSLSSFKPLSTQDLSNIQDGIISSMISKEEQRQVFLNLELNIVKEALGSQDIENLNNLILLIQKFYNSSKIIIPQKLQPIINFKFQDINEKQVFLNNLVGVVNELILTLTSQVSQPQVELDPNNELIANYNFFKYEGVYFAPCFILDSSFRNALKNKGLQYTEKQDLNSLISAINNFYLQLWQEHSGDIPKTINFYDEFCHRFVRGNEFEHTQSTESKSFIPSKWLFEAIPSMSLVSARYTVGKDKRVYIGKYTDDSENNFIYLETLDSSFTHI